MDLTDYSYLFSGNATLREHQLILDWLEQTSYEENPIQVAHYGDRSAMAWENTLHHLQVSWISLLNLYFMLIK